MTGKTIKKHERELRILMGLIKLYLKLGKPIGSNTLKECGFHDLSSATIRNYFVKLEDQGFLTQHHASGGRIPTELAFKFYAKHEFEDEPLSKKQKKELEKHFIFDGREVVTYLSSLSELLSEQTNCAAFISAPRFDQDFISDIRLLSISPSKLLVVMISSFGVVHTETYPAQNKLSNFSLRRIENYLHFKMTGLDKPSLSEEESALGENLYKEVMLRHIVSQTNILHEDLFKTGFSKLLSYEELCHAQALGNCLSLFENTEHMEALISHSLKDPELKVWIGEDLKPFIMPPYVCSVITVPYMINQKPVGIIGLMGPLRMPYKHLFEVLKFASNKLSENLTKLLFKHHISYRMPESKSLDFKPNHSLYLNETSKLLIDDRSNLEEDNPS